MNELETVKNYLRIDSDLTEDDILLNELINASHTYIENSTNKKFDCNNELMLMLSKLLVAHWYTNRNILSKSTTIEKSNPFNKLVKEFKISELPSEKTCIIGINFIPRVS